MMGYLKRREIESLEPREEPPMEVLGWIPVEERLPEEGVSVLVNHWLTGIEMAYRRGDQWGITWTGFMGSGSGYTHWMPLPEPPEVE